MKMWNKTGFLFFYFLAAGILISAPAWASDFKASGVSGKVTAVRDGETRVVAEGDALENGDRILTAEDSRLDVIKAGAWGYRLLASSESVIHADETKTEIEMPQGNVIFKVNPMQGRDLSVRTPVVVVAVRGTQFWGQVLPAGTSHNSTFAVREGDVEVTVVGSENKMMLQAGQAIDVQGESATAAAREAKPAELDAISQIEDLALE